MVLLAEGHASITSPPEEPQPVDPLTSVDGVIQITLVVANPVSVTVTAEALQELAPIAVVAFVKVVFAIGTPPLAAGRIPPTSAVSDTKLTVICETLLLSAPM
jgi:hypothetical protein